MNIRKIVAPLLIAMLAMVLLLELPQAIAARSRDYDWYTPVIDVRTLLGDRYVRTIDPEAMQRAALKAMVDSLDDPHTIYVAPAQQGVFEKEMSGRYTGIGAEIRPSQDRLLIVTPLDGSPAYDAGLRGGDLVLDIDGTDTHGLSSQDCVDLLLGKPGTTVGMRIRRPDGVEEDVEVVRGAIDAGTVEGLFRRDGQWRHWLDEDSGMAYLELDQFTNSTPQELVAFLHAHGETLNGLIIDLRGNPGGALPAAIDAADLFLDNGPIVHIRPDREDRAAESRTYSARPGHAAEQLPVVLLVDQHSASASEILAGALQHGGDARVLGERTFGKGTVQEVRPLDNNKGLVKFTTAHYALPDGRIIQRRKDTPDAPWGVDPSDGCIVPENESQRLARIQAREPWRIITREEPVLDGATDPQWIRDTLADPALAEAAQLLLARLQNAAWPELDDDADQAFQLPSDELTRARSTQTLLLDRLTTVESEITRLTDAGIDAPRGFDALPDDTRVGTVEVILRDADGVALGTWRADDPAVARAALSTTMLEKIGDT